jgi:TonB family protein
MLFSPWKTPFRLLVHVTLFDLVRPMHAVRVTTLLIAAFFSTVSRRMHRAQTLRLAMLACCAAGAFAVSPATLAGDTEKAATHIKYPVIPPEAKAKHLRGSGVILVHVRPDGTVERAEVARSSGHKILDDAALAAFSQWQFIPGRLSKATIPFTFTGNYEKPKASSQSQQPTATPCANCPLHD